MKKQTGVIEWRGQQYDVTALTINRNMEVVDSNGNHVVDRSDYPKFIAKALKAGRLA